MARCTRPGPHPATPSATHSSFTVCGVYVWKKPQDRHFPSCCLLAPPPAYLPPLKSAGSSRPTRWLRCFKLPSHVSAVFLCGPGCSQYAGVLCLAYVVFSGNLSQNVKTRELYRCVGPHSCRAATPGGTGPSHRGGARSSSLPCRGPPPTQFSSRLCGWLLPGGDTSPGAPVSIKREETGGSQSGRHGLSWPSLPPVLTVLAAAIAGCAARLPRDCGPSADGPCTGQEDGQSGSGRTICSCSGRTCLPRSEGYGQC